MRKKQGSGTTAIHGGKGPYDNALPTESVITPI